MSNLDASFCAPLPYNEPICDYAPGDERRESLKKRLKKMASEKVEIPCLIGGKEVFTGKTKTVVMPHDHSHVLAEFHLAGPEEMHSAVAAAQRAKSDWETLSWNDRVAICLPISLCTKSVRAITFVIVSAAEGPRTGSARVTVTCCVLSARAASRPYVTDIGPVTWKEPPVSTTG